MTAYAEGELLVIEDRFHDVIPEEELEQMREAYGESLA
jgi:hypothetical protein